jgi:hypothetical protein
MPSIYRISPQQAEVERKKSLMRSLTFLAAIFAAVIIFTPAAKEDSRSTLLFLIFMGALLAFIMFRQLRSINRAIRKGIESYELEIDETQITRRHADLQPLTIGFGEITEIEQRTGQGTRIKTAQSNRNIWLPCEIEEYGAALEMIRQRSGAALKKRNYNWVRMYSAAVVYLIGWFILMYSHERRLVLTLSAALTIGLLWCVVVIWRNPGVSRKLKLRMLFALLPIAALVARFVQAW